MRIVVAAVVPVVLATAMPLAATAEPGAAPTAQVARLCMRYSYIAYPYQRPGSVPMSGDRQSYYKDCVAKEGNVPAPEPPAPKS